MSVKSPLRQRARAFFAHGPKDLGQAARPASARSAKWYRLTTPAAGPEIVTVRVAGSTVQGKPVSAKPSAPTAKAGLAAGSSSGGRGNFGTSGPRNASLPVSVREISPTCSAPGTPRGAVTGPSASG